MYSSNLKSAFKYFLVSFLTVNFLMILILFIYKHNESGWLNKYVYDSIMVNQTRFSLIHSIKTGLYIAVGMGLGSYIGKKYIRD